MSSKTCVQIFLADLFIITKAKNNPNFFNWQVNELWYIQTMELKVAMKTEKE